MSGGLPLHVIASEAKQSGSFVSYMKDWIASSQVLLAMTLAILVPGAMRRGSVASQTRDRYGRDGLFRIFGGPGSAAHRFALRSIRGRAPERPGHDERV
jgi:hypothetical protein